jgi:hypothetical protein
MISILYALYNVLNNVCTFLKHTRPSCKINRCTSYYYELPKLPHFLLFLACYNLIDMPSFFWQSLRLLGDASVSFEKNCVRGIEANHKRISQLLHEVTMLINSIDALSFFLHSDYYG